MCEKLREMICISCPIGCRLTVTWRQLDGALSISVAGNKCPRGEEYAREEISAPKRIVTATCSIDSDICVRAPVRTDTPLPKALIPELLKEAYRLKLRAPVRAGDIVIENFRGSGVNLIAGRTIER